MPDYPERRVRGFEHPVEKISAGRYRYRGRYVIRTSWDDGPRGGIRYWWELGTVDNYGGVSLDGILPFRTLREALAEIDQEQSS